MLDEAHGKLRHKVTGELQRGIENVEYVRVIAQLLRENTHQKY
jgi:hypothetical protein